MRFELFVHEKLFRNAIHVLNGDLFDTHQYSNQVLLGKIESVVVMLVFLAQGCEVRPNLRLV